jgi:hypothetical protein
MPKDGLASASGVAKAYISDMERVFDDADLAALLKQ